jgi:hypothetical protein
MPHDPALAVYVAALRDGRTVISVLARDDAEKDRAKRALAAAGAHFMNSFGRLARRPARVG